MRPRRTRRRLLLMRSRRAVQRHFFSLVSAMVLLGALMVLLTDGNIGPPRQPVAEGGAVVAATQASGKTPPRSAPETGTVIYYIVGSVQQMDALHTVRRGETVYREYEGAPLQPPTAVYYLIFDTPEQEAAGAKLLHQVAELAPLQGFNLTVVDLTR